LKILVDADSCPKPARNLILKTAARRRIQAIFAANRPLPGIGGPGHTDTGRSDDAGAGEPGNAGAGGSANACAGGPGEGAGEPVYAVMELCPEGEGAADDRIVALAAPGDLAVTRDIPLANRLVEASVLVIDDRGQTYTRENIRERLSLRDFRVGLAENGMETERSAVYGKRELKTFADALDRALTKLGAGSGPAGPNSPRDRDSAPV
jgi:uncharacterized protein YaiI (UPF0178 family)